jgi:hypothetical protein
MPVFFFVGGFSNFRSFESTLRRGEPAARFLKTRLVRLLTPTGVFIWVWLMILLGLFLAGSLTPRCLKATRILVGPLWFLLVYLFVTALTPATYRLHKWFGMSALAIAVFIAAGMDVLRFSLNLTGAGWANVVLIWLFAHQLGYFYADRTLVRARPRVYLVLALFGLVGLLGLTLSGLYPKSMVGTGFGKVSNMNPPTICIVALTLWLVGVAMYLRRAASRRLARPGPWKLAVVVNSLIMTVYLWHLTAYGAVFGVLALIGFSGSAPGTANWWLERTIWVGGSFSVLIPLVLLFGRFERPTVNPAAAN